MTAPRWDGEKTLTAMYKPQSLVICYRELISNYFFFFLPLFHKNFFNIIIIFPLLSSSQMRPVKVGEFIFGMVRAFVLRAERLCSSRQAFNNSAQEMCAYI